MKKQTMPTGFSGFAWGLAAFCLPILLWPMASLLSTAFVKNPTPVSYTHLTLPTNSRV